MLLLLVVFRSVTIAVKAAVMNLLSISAAYGVLVMVSAERVARLTCSASPRRCR